MRGRRFLLLFYLLCILSFCLGTVWKTEDAYIIDDTIDDPVERVATKESTNVCFDSTGAEGRCVSIQECSPFSNFFSSENNHTRLEILEGLKRHLNSSGEPCIPTIPVELPTTTEGVLTSDESNFVCCISLKYSNVRIASSLDEYLLQSHTPQSSKEPAIPQVPPGIGNSTGVAVADTYIVSGSVARIGEFPFAVAIIYNGKQFCGGSLLDSQWILSAAHCFDQFNSEKVRRLAISIGDHDVSTNNEAQNQVAYVSKLFLHPGFFRSKGYFVSDVALIKLKNPIYGYSNVRTVSLHSGTSNIYQGNVEAIVIGWGKTCDHNSCPQSSTVSLQHRLLTRG